MKELRRLLRSVPLPDEREAGERSWRVVRAAYEEREPVPRPRHRLRPLAVAAVGLAVLAGAFSPPGRAVLGSLRDAIGREQVLPARRQLFSLPAPGRLLVVSSRGPWIVRPDGSRRLLGAYADASWSPHGLYVVASRADELLAVDPKGKVRWSLPRPEVGGARWGGTRLDTRIAYFSHGNLRVVAGDGTEDQFLADHPAATPPAWRPGARHDVALADPEGRVYVYEVDGALRLLGRSAPGEVPTKLVWSDDGKRLLAVSPTSVRVLDARARLVVDERTSRRSRVRDAVFVPGGHRFAEIRVHEAQSAVYLLPGGRELFRGAGRFRELAWSPNGRWLLVSWPTADQWIFVRSVGVRRIVAVSNIAEQFGGSFPRLAGWCCSQR